MKTLNILNDNSFCSCINFFTLTLLHCSCQMYIFPQFQEDSQLGKEKGKHIKININKISKPH